MLRRLLLPIVDPARVSNDVLRLQRTSHELTTEELHNLSTLLTQRVRLAEALVEYTMAVAGSPRVN